MKTLKYGATGDEVLSLQKKLNSYGFHVQEDGIFGNETYNAVMEFQGSRNLVVDGVVGSKTWETLLDDSDEDPDWEWSLKQLEYLDGLKEAHHLGITGIGKFPLEMDEKDVYKVIQVLKDAVLQYGRREIPKGSNGGPELAEIVDAGGDGKPPSAYWLYWGVADKDVLKTMPAWCCIFVSWAIRKGLSTLAGRLLKWDETPFGKWFGGCSSHLEPWAVERKTFVTPSAYPEGIVPGMVFTIGPDWVNPQADNPKAAAHTGFVLEVLPDGRFVTIEGNAGDRVNTYTRKISSVRKFIWWW
jgi:hypothetical protein